MQYRNEVRTSKYWNPYESFRSATCNWENENLSESDVERKLNKNLRSRA